MVCLTLHRPRLWSARLGHSPVSPGAEVLGPQGLRCGLLLEGPGTSPPRAEYGPGGPSVGYQLLS